MTDVKAARGCAATGTRPVMARWSSPHPTASRLRDRLRQERGQVLVEFAIVLPILVAIVMGILYFSRYEDYSNQETQLAEQGARFAAVDHNPSSSLSLQKYVESLAQPELQYGSNDVSPVQVYIYDPTGSTGAVGDTVRACVVTTLQFPLGLGSGTLAQTATMRVEQAQTSAQWTPDSTSSLPSSCPTS
ncbi:MAG: TadE/TadG family type IV pilus assembly protein [Solirubrobacteraceae bacterium]